MVNMLSIGELLKNRYSIIRKVSDGDYGVVYQALDTRTREKVAIKEIHPGETTTEDLKYTVSGFYDEIKYLRSVKHLNLVKFHEGFEVNGVYYCITQWVEGKTLQQVLEENRKPLEGIKVVSLFFLLLDFVIFMHKQEIPYALRLLRPSDIIVNNEGHVMIIDLGLAMNFQPPRVPDGYIMPDEESDSTRDIFHIGSVIYELVTCVKPGSAQIGSLATPDEINKSVPKSLSNVITRCLKPRRERYKYISDVKTELSRWYPEYNKATGISALN
jgi:serine/threonine protein kinase